MKEFAAAIAVVALSLTAAAEIRIGIIGCDTSHTIDMTKRINVQKQADFADMRVTCAYQWGSKDIVSSTNRYPKYLPQLRDMGVKIVPSIQELLGEVDAVLIETNDGREHYQQALEVFKAGKPCFIDKPLAHNLKDAVKIVKAAKRYNAKFFSTSNNRYQPNPQKARKGEFGPVISAVLYAPYITEPTHNRYTWYAIHGFEILETIMQRGCESVTVTSGKADDLVACKWKDGRVGLVHCEQTVWDYGGHILTSRSELIGRGQFHEIGKDSGYEELLVDIARLFKDGIVPIEPEETLEVAAMMEAAELSRSRNGQTVTIAEVMAMAESAAAVDFIQLDPGHFHSALVQKRAYPANEVSPIVNVFAPDGPELDGHLAFISSFNSRKENACSWVERVVKGADYLQRFNNYAASLSEADRRQTAVVLAGRNDRKAEYALAAIENGMNVFADKPLAIDEKSFLTLSNAVTIAQSRGLAFADMMTDRQNVYAHIQAALARSQEVFGDFIAGSAAEPTVEKESVHHFLKQVNGAPLRRPAWYYDTSRQGEAIVDVTSHMVDTTQTLLYPGAKLDFADVAILSAKSWPTSISRAEYAESTGLSDWPEYLRAKVDGDDVLKCEANGEFIYRLKDFTAKISARWEVKAAAGGGDAERSIVRGTKAEIEVSDTPTHPEPVVWVRPRNGVGVEELGAALKAEIAKLSKRWAGLSVVRDGVAWRVVVPEALVIAHEEQFNAIAAQFFGWMHNGQPEAEYANLLVKYHTLVSARAAAHLDK